FLADIEKEGGVPQLSLLSCDQSAISVLYNVEFKGTVYNLQSGYLESFHKKLSIGSLHLGYCIEEAFLDPGVRLFDLLAGGGKNDNYKKRLATDITPLVSVMIVRGTLLKLLYLLKHPDW
ncbi:GNAT family N-acetyltransferase, partial [Marinobacter alexandrii]